MKERPGTWGEVSEGTTLLSPTQLPLVIVKTARTKAGLWYLAHDHNGDERRIAPKPSDQAVTILECTPEEAEMAAVHGLGAERILDFEHQARMPERSKRWIVPDFPSKGRGALDMGREHLRWYHGVHDPALKTLKQMAAAHAEMHGEPLMMDMPHTHQQGDAQ